MRRVSPRDLTSPEPSTQLPVAVTFRVRMAGLGPQKSMHRCRSVLSGVFFPIRWTSTAAFTNSAGWVFVWFGAEP
jgi:hypothetical protein